ncbi:MAG TPA: hypothetical protein GXZ27_07970 [Thermoanaerobacterales bacterium]|jgi:hypothetical protein|nr:hypothetical protein [Thermoanaerobacterales bacterium]
MWGGVVNDFLEKDQVISHCEDLIKKIKDIVSAKIVTGDDGKISEIHVISKSNRNPKQIVRDIESTLIAFLGSEIDHKKISVAQIKSEDERFVETRLRIEGILTNKTYNSLEVKVSLADPEGKIFEGIANGAASFQSRMRTTACATLNAISLFLAESFVLSLDDVHTFKIGNHQAVSVLISVLTSEKDEYLLGSALIKQDTYEAVVAAVLSAINRRISLLIKE